MTDTPEQKAANEQLREAVLACAKAWEWGDGFPVDIVCCVAWQPLSDLEVVRYGRFYAEEQSQHHRTVGLLDVCRRIAEEDADD